MSTGKDGYAIGRPKPTSATERSGAGSGAVAKAARLVLPKIDSDHAAAPLLQAMAIRLAQDIDEAREVRDRVAAGRALIDLLQVLDPAAPPPPRGAGIPAAGGSEGHDANPFGIPVVPPGVGDSA